MEADIAKVRVWHGQDYKAVRLGAGVPYALCMRKLLVVALAAGALVLAAASPALAQRDPFDPIVDPNSGTAPSGSADSTETTEEPVFAPSEPESMPNTGSDPSSWLAIAYALIVMGAGTIALAKIYRPQYLIARCR